MESTQMSNASQLRLEVWKRELFGLGFGNVEIFETIDGKMAVKLDDFGVTIIRDIPNGTADGLLEWVLYFFKQVKLKDPDYAQAKKFKEVMQWACK